MGKADLIKTVRGLDQSGPGDNGEKLDALWQSLAAGADGQFHAAEESSLRWLLKSMNGSSPAVETLRRFPLTWTILGRVFQRVPLFSLAKSLADRKFISILQQSLKELSRPEVAEGSQKTSKRKRSPPKTFKLEDLKSSEACLECAATLFQALGVLLQRLEGKTSSSHDRIGSEHLRSLFCTSATEATAIASPALSICTFLLESRHFEGTEGRDDWISTIASIWALHLQGSDDTLEVATHILGPGTLALTKLEDSLGAEKSSIPEELRVRWSSDLQGFLHHNFILPARSSYLNRQDLEPVVRALEVTKQNIDVSAPAIYFLASGATQILTESGTLKGNAEWMKQLFNSISTALQHSGASAKSIYKNILKQARKASMPVNTDDVLNVCRAFALADDNTDWELVAHIAQCDPDVFQLSGVGEKLLKDVQQRTLDHRVTETDQESILEVIDAIVRGFRTTRNFSAFLRLWLEQLIQVNQKEIQTSPWSHVGQADKLPSFDSLLVQKDLSSRQLFEVLEWAGKQQIGPEALCIWLDTIVKGIQSVEFQDAVGKPIWELALRVQDSSSAITALKWSVISQVFGWLPLAERMDRWQEIRRGLTKILKKGDLLTPETLQASKCCSQVWASLLPDGTGLAEVMEIVEAFTSRFSAAASSLKSKKLKQLAFYLDGKTDAGFHEAADMEQYLAWYLKGFSRFVGLHFQKTGKVPEFIFNLVSQPKANPTVVESIWKTLLLNEHNLNRSKLVEQIVNQVIESLRASINDESSWPGDKGVILLQVLSSIPLDAISRPQREVVVGLLIGEKSGKRLSQSSSLENWKLLLGLLTKLMRRPTFYEGMCFQHLTSIADTLSEVLVHSSVSHEVLLEFIERYASMAVATMRQMADHIEDRSLKYFSESSSLTVLVNGPDESAENSQSLRLTLLRALAGELSLSSSFSNVPELVAALESAKRTLSDSISTVVSNWLADKKLFKKSSTQADLLLLASLDSAEAVSEFPGLASIKSSSWKKLSKRSIEALEAGDIRGIQLQAFIWRNMGNQMDASYPTVFPDLEESPTKLLVSLSAAYVEAISLGMDLDTKMQYLESLIGAFLQGTTTSGQLVAINCITEQLIKNQQTPSSGMFDLSSAHSELTRCLHATNSKANAAAICRILYTVLEKKPQAVGQWNVETLLGTIAVLSSQGSHSAAPFLWRCKLVEIIIKKHRLRLEGHYHVLLNVLQSLIQELVFEQEQSNGKDGDAQEPNAHAYCRLITLVCEPTAGAASRSQQHSALDSATDAAKRSAGRHMYLVLMQYVKLQLEADVPRSLRDVLEPAMNSIFDITPPEGRKILNDAMDSSGRAILREMFKRYSRFGKWSGV
ncbi:unnamed protein product [Clonostachys rosea]|uniref:Nucleolar 27S pre-rRNA processing Urb2/Npa2 C-terminal domain-containing protein n=1 Tax=Bionectria ochroleuca TaxID=29856 RepID=A0ABY6ULU1_BIOOC|nr:unnamed protein product [Clonostachys rosea]